jgi:hypothetical protein
MGNASSTLVTSPYWPTNSIPPDTNHSTNDRSVFTKVARPEGFEPPTLCSGDKRTINGSGVAQTGDSSPRLPFRC